MLLGRNLPICNKLILTSTLRTRLILMGEAMSRTVKKIGREKNNEEVSSDAMIVGNGKSSRMWKANSLMKDYV